MEDVIRELANQVYTRTIELILAPLNNMDMLWTAIPLFIATLFMILYFGRYKQEELGWNTAFGNTMVFLFVALGIIREMFNQGGGSIESLFSSDLYTVLSLGLIATGFFLMFFTYFHLLPKRLAFFLFSAPPINVSVYVVMAIVYANVIPDWITVLAAVVLLFVILVLGKVLQLFLKLFGLEYRIKQLVPEELVEDKEKIKKKR
jgi:hypothetical protein